ncbi:DUF2892 domain-containing protein [Pseudorhodobacter sp. E13]|uniref:YgaP family membrane protein n=1 Tax=Pseudorhodobacter sp. E13 TaxID=2487931 RepID=UPI000F8CB226|nr:DUF2892 domain-containing protein [Pseudorhodobacter sp. E13]RUS59095.1 DUF2892 domain-containing protein [Pseudorhodobacter sp. E13]
MFKTNVGGIDRILRIAVGVALLAAYFLMPGMGYRWVFIVLGVIALGTGLMKTCPLYSIFGISSCPLSKR